MTILYSPDGQPVFANDRSRINELLQVGYTTAQLIVENGEVKGRAVEPALAAATQLTGDLSVNAASLKELVDLPGVSTVIARKIRDGRPYVTLEDLIARVPEIAWTAIRDRVNVKPDESQQTVNLPVDPPTTISPN